MKKRFLTLFLALMFVFSINAFAAEPRNAIINPTLTFRGTTATCAVTITDFGSDIEATITLYHGRQIVDSWSGEGTNVLTINGSCEVEDGETYTLEVTGKIDNVSFTPVTKNGTC